MTAETLVAVCPMLLTLVDGYHCGIDLKILNNTETGEIADRVDRLIEFVQDLVMTTFKNSVDHTGSIYDEVAECGDSLNRYRYFDTMKATAQIADLSSQFMRTVTAEILGYDSMADLGHYAALVLRETERSGALSKSDLQRAVELFISIEVHALRTVGDERN